MSDKDCLICCEAITGKYLDVQNVETLSRTLFGHPLEFSNDKDSFQLLFQSATYCSKCVGKVQDLGVLFRELEALERKLDNEKAQIKNQIMQGCVFYDWSRSSDSVDNHNQKLRKIIVTRLNEQEGTIDPLNTETEGEQLLQSSIPVFSEVEIPSIGDIFSPPSPTRSNTSLNSFEDEEKFSPEELSSIDLVLTTPLKSSDDPEGVALTNRKMKTRISTGVLKKRFTCETCEESFRLASQLKKHKYTFGHDGKPAETGTDEETESMISVQVRQNEKTMGNSSQLSNRDSHCDKRLPVIILHKLNDTETKAALTRVRRNIVRIRKRYTEIKPVRSKISKLREKKIKNATPKKKSTGHQHQSINETVGIEKSESNSSSQPKANRKRKIMKVKEPRTRCPFFPGCITTFGIVDQEIKIKAHVRKRHEGMKHGYLCEAENCGESFPLLKELRAHESWKHKGIHPYICSHCEEVCTSKHHLKLHIAVTHKPEEIKFKCEFCDRGFINHGRLRLHLMKHTKKRPFLCELCSKTFNTSQLLKYHQSQHHAEVTRLDPYKCDECGKIFSTPQYLRQHIKKIHRREFRYQCEICGYGSMMPSGLKQHINQCHSDERNFKCEQCDRCYKVKRQLTVHIRTHTGERPYVCKIESCKKAFIDSGNLRRHELTHSSDQRHECKVCGKIFPQHNYLYVHMKSHNKKK